MTALRFSQFAELWQEQVDSEELAGLQARARKIEQTAKRKRLLDFALAFVAFAMTFLFLSSQPTSLPIKLGFVPLLAGIIWLSWKRHQITRVWRSIAVDDPRVFFAAAIRNVRAEISMSAIAFYAGPLAFISGILLTNGGFDWIFRLPRNIFMTAIIFMFVIPGHVYFTLEIAKLRKQLRRFESMSREWDDQPVRGPRENR